MTLTKYNKLSSLLFALLLPFSSGCSAGTTEYGAELYAMSTLISITVWGDDPKETIKEGENFIYAMENKFSTTRATSEISQINESPEEWHQISDEVAEVLQFSKEISLDTQGTFDPTVYPLVEAWGFTQSLNRIPEQDEIQDLLTLVDASQIQLEENQVQLSDNMKLDLGAIAKGYITDKLAEQMREDNVKSAMISLGGNVYVLGKKIDGSLWNIGIQNPYGGGAIGSVQTYDKAVITSGGYQRYFTDSETGESYWHIIDPRTGSPATSGLASVSIISDSGMRGDALSTALFVMGLEEAINYWNRYKDFDMVLICEDGDIYITSGIANNFTLVKNYSQGTLQVIS